MQLVNLKGQTVEKIQKKRQILKERKGKGKIMISVNGAFHELEAMTENDKIQSGSVVKVVKIENNNILIVETI